MKKEETIGGMAMHATVIGFAVFTYMIIFGHGLPTKLRGPLIKLL